MWGVEEPEGVGWAGLGHVLGVVGCARDRCGSGVCPVDRGRSVCGLGVAVREG